MQSARNLQTQRNRSNEDRIEGKDLNQRKSTDKTHREGGEKPLKFNLNKGSVKVSKFNDKSSAGTMDNYSTQNQWFLLQ